MKKLIIIGFYSLISGTAFAQTSHIVQQNPTPTPGYPPSAISRPYWVDRPIIEVLGRATLEFTPNRVSFAIVVEETNNDADTALSRVAARTRPAIEKVQNLMRGKGQISVTYLRDELYQQYRDREGNKIENTREDKVENYVARYIINIKLDDATLLPNIKAELLAVGNAKMQSEAEYSFVPSTEQARSMFRSAMKDGEERAKIVAEAHHGRTKLLVFEEGVTQCISSQTGPIAIERMTVQVAPTEMISNITASSETVVVTGQKRKLTSQELIMPASPEPVQIEASVCMVYAIDQ